MCFGKYFPTFAVLSVVFASGTAFGDNVWPYGSQTNGSNPIGQWVNSLGDVNSLPMGNYYSPTVSYVPLDTPALVPGSQGNYSSPAAMYLPLDAPATAPPSQMNYYSAGSSFVPLSAPNFDPMANVMNNFSAASGMGSNLTDDQTMLMLNLALTVPAGWTPPPAPVRLAPVQLTNILPISAIQEPIIFASVGVGNPEPGTWGFMALGFVVLSLLYRRAKRASRQLGEIRS